MTYYGFMLDDKNYSYCVGEDNSLWKWNLYSDEVKAEILELALEEVRG